MEKINIKFTKCLHQNITITRKSRYDIPHGWKKEEESADCDLGRYFIEEEQTEIFCEDCGEYL